MNTNLNVAIAPKDSTFQVRINSEIKRAVEDIYAKAGMTLTDAFNTFIQQSLNVEGLPFIVTKNSKEALREQAVAMRMLDLKRAEERAEIEGWIDADDLERELGKKINNYEEYQKRLKEFFSGIKEMPSNEEVQSFIDEYNLFIDWQIIIPDVKKDISSLMLKNITGKSKSISSYKQYLEKLKESFGSLDEMPSRKQIEEFIEEYNLGKSWGIVEEDVVKDLEEIINGKYDDMLKDSAYVHDITVKKK